MDKKSLRNIIIALFFFVISAFLIRNTLELRKNEARLNVLISDVEKLEESRNRLNAEVSYRETDDFVEQQAREVLNLVKENEKTFVLSSEYESNVLAVTDARPDPINGTKSNIRLWFELIF